MGRLHRIWILSLSAPLSLAASPQEAELVLWNGRVMTLAAERPEATAIAVRGDRVIGVGEDAPILRMAGARARRVDLGGRFVLPGLADAHVHLRSLGEQLTSVDLRGLTSVEVVAARVRAKAAGASGDEWIQGIGWDQTLWPGRAYPDHRPLTEAVPDRPVWLQRIDWYAGWANRKALEAAGVTRDTKDPQGGRIVKDAAGEPTGLFLGEAMNLVARAQPPLTRARIKNLLRPALRRCVEVGLTEVHDAAATLEEAAAFRELADEGALPLRVYLMWKGYGGTDVAAMLAHPPFVDYKQRLTLRTLKLIVDGTMGSHGALFFEDYSDDPGNRGFFVTPEDELRRSTEAAFARGYQVATHAIGDRAIRLALDTFAGALAKNPRRDPRPRIEHLQCVRPADLADVKRLGIVASMQPSHATSEFTWSESRVGAARGRGLYALRSVLAAGIPLAFGSDLPVDAENPLVGLHSAVTRQDPHGQPPGGWHPEEKLTLDEAIRAYTTGAAYAAFEEDRRGRIAPGLWADLTVLERDLRAVPPEELADVGVAMTIVGGVVVYEAPRETPVRRGGGSQPIGPRGVRASRGR